MNFKLIFISRIVLFLLGLTGVVLEIVKYGGGMLMYYTILSNLLVTLFLAYLLYLMKQDDGRWNSTQTLRLKGGVTMAIMITCVIYHLLLAPIATDFYRLENFLCHYIVPLGFLFDTLFFDENRHYRLLDPLAWTSVPLLYMVFALFNGLVTKIPVPDAKDSPFPYFFLNVGKYGWAYVIQMSLTIFVAYLVAGYVLYGVKNFSFKGSRK